MTHLLCLFLAIFLFHILGVWTQSLRLLTESDLESYKYCHSDKIMDGTGYPLRRIKSCQVNDKFNCHEISLKKSVVIEHIKLEIYDYKGVKLRINRTTIIEDYNHAKRFKNVKKITMKTNSEPLCAVKIIEVTEDSGTEFLEKLENKHIKDFTKCDGSAGGIGQGYPFKENAINKHFEKGTCLLVVFNRNVSLIDLVVITDSTENNLYELNVDVFVGHAEQEYNSSVEVYENIDRITLNVIEKTYIKWVKGYAYIYPSKRSTPPLLNPSLLPSSTSPSNFSSPPPTTFESSQNFLTGKLVWILLVLAALAGLMLYTRRRYGEDESIYKPAQLAKPSIGSLFKFDFTRKDNIKMKMLKKKLDRTRGIKKDIDRPKKRENEMFDLNKYKTNEHEVLGENTKVDLENLLTEEKLKEVQIIEELNMFSMDVMQLPKLEAEKRKKQEKDKDKDKKDKGGKKKKNEPNEELDLSKNEQKLKNKTNFDEEMKNENEDRVDDTKVDFQNENEENLKEEQKKELDIQENNLENEANIKKKDKKGKNKEKNKKSKDKKKGSKRRKSKKNKKNK